MNSLFALILFLLPFRVHAETMEDVCTGYPNVPVTIIPYFDEAVQDYTQPQSVVQQMAARKNQTHEQLTFGLAQYEPIIGFQAKMKGLQSPDGKICGHVESAEVTLGFQNTRVFIANEIPAFGCAFYEVLNHEKHHVEVNRELLIEYVPQIQQKVSQYLKLNGVFRDVTPDYAKAVLNEKVSGLISEILNDMASENQRRQAEVDSPEEYKRITYACDGQLAHLAARKLGYER
jgi:hypothetical protein